MKKIITLTITLILALVYTHAQYTLTLADVNFEASTSTIKDYKGTTTDIINPEGFKVNGNILEVRVIEKEEFRDSHLNLVTKSSKYIYEKIVTSYCVDKKNINNPLNHKDRKVASKISSKYYHI